MPSPEFLKRFKEKYSSGTATSPSTVDSEPVTAQPRENIEVKKWALAEVQTEDFYKRLKRFYAEREEDSKFLTMPHVDLLDYFYNDRTWKNLNTVSMGKELYDIKSGERDETYKGDLAYINEVYLKLPSFWDDPNRNFGEWLKDFGGAMVLDPVNLIGFGIGGAGAKVAYRTAMRKALKDKTAATMRKELLKDVKKDAQQQALRKTVQQGALIEGGINAGIAGIHDLMSQQVGLETGAQSEFDLKRLGYSTGAGFGFGTVFGGAFTYGGFKYKGRRELNRYGKNMEDLHNYGVATMDKKWGKTIRGEKLFEDVTRDHHVKTDLYEFKTKKQKLKIGENVENQLYETSATVEERLNRIDKDIVDTRRGAEKVDLETTIKNAERPVKKKKMTAAEKKKKKEKISPTKITEESKPPKELLNLWRLSRKGQKHKEAIQVIKLLSDQIRPKLKSKWNILTEEKIRQMASKLGQDPEKVYRDAMNYIKNGRGGEYAATVLALNDMLVKNADHIYKLAHMTNWETISKNKMAKVLATLEERRGELNLLADITSEHKRVTAQTLVLGKTSPDPEKAKLGLKASKLQGRPEDPKYKKILMEGTEDEIKDFWNMVGQLDTDDKVIAALQDTRQINKWNLASEYINNNLLSSPDTHMLNLVSSIFQMHWKPMVMMIRAAHLAPKDSARARVVLREAFDTLIYQYVYTMEGLRAAGRALVAGRPLLDSLHNKMDTSIRQGQLQAWIKLMGKHFGGKVGEKIGAAAGFVQTIPIRVLSAGDEFLKTVAFRARAGAQINSAIARTHPHLLSDTIPRRYSKKTGQYKELFDQYFNKYMEKESVVGRVGKHEIKGKAGKTAGEMYPKPIKHKWNREGFTEADRNIVNDAMNYAREVTYTQGAFAINPKTGKTEGRVTGAILGLANKIPALRALGLHFINTPSNLMRWNLQHVPIFGKYQFQMRHMLMKDDATGKYLNQEAAMEAKARLSAAWALWGTAIWAAVTGKVTGGGSKDFRVNEERSKFTGWQSYAMQTDESQWPTEGEGEKERVTGGSFRKMERGDPFNTPFFVAADLVEAFDDFFKHTEELPKPVADRITDISFSILMGLTRNFSSKFYAKGMIESAEMIAGDSYLYNRDFDRFAGSVMARGIYKITPLSSGIRYKNRIKDSWEREVWNMTDRLRVLNPFTDVDRIMPKRNALGIKIDRKRGWLFGIGGDTGIWSSPFAMSNWKNDETWKFFEEENRHEQTRQWAYTRPNKLHKESQIDLRTLRNKKGQTAYDRFLELKQYVTTQYKGKPYYLKELIEIYISDPESPLHSYTDNLVDSFKDYQQAEIIKLIHDVETVAYKKMESEFPILKETEIKRENILFNLEAEQRQHIKEGKVGKKGFKLKWTNKGTSIDEHFRRQVY